MANELGKYDDLCTHVMQVSKAQGAAVIILEGAYGSGFSVQATMHDQQRLPNILRELADNIDKELLRQQKIKTRKQ